MRKTRLAGAEAALAAGLLTVLLTAAMVPLAVAAHQNPATTVTETIAVTLPFAAVGMIVAIRQPRIPVGWLMLYFGLGVLLSVDAVRTTSPSHAARGW
jgi:peptidoglycan/LPS O-acetylase OafA/YrhL